MQLFHDSRKRDLESHFIIKQDNLHKALVVLLKPTYCSTVFDFIFVPLSVRQRCQKGSKGQELGLIKAFRNKKSNDSKKVFAVFLFVILFLSRKNC